MTTPSVATLVHESLGECVYKSLRDYILSQAYPPGSKLIVKQLCRNLRVSRTPVYAQILVSAAPLSARATGLERG
jgi:DNA-binding GntR family transcriptional regulator